jgi:hypothetical protein
MINEDTVIIKEFLDKRDVFEKFGHYVMGLKNLERVMYLMLGFIKKFYEKYPDSNSIPESEFRIFLGSYDTMNFTGTYGEYLKQVYTITNINQSLTMDIIEGCVERHIAANVLDKTALIIENNKKQVLGTIQDDIDEYNSIIRQPTRDMKEYKADLATLVKQEISSIGAPFINPKPNSVIRGMKVGQLGLIYAYVDTGKTSYGVANNCSVAKYLASIKSDRPTVYACNEEDVSRVTLRHIQCITGRSDQEIEADVKGTQAILKASGYDYIRFIDHVRNTRIVEKILNKYNPRVMFIDQGTKVSVTGSKRDGVDALEEKFGLYRDLAKLYQCTIVCMAQGGEACFDKKFPELTDIYGSRSAVQGELDWAIAIGRDISDVKYNKHRYFNITKNKGDKSQFACTFDHKRCQFKEVT